MTIKKPTTGYYNNIFVPVNVSVFQIKEAYRYGLTIFFFQE